MIHAFVVSFCQPKLYETHSHAAHVESANRPATGCWALGSWQLIWFMIERIDCNNNLGDCVCRCVLGVRACVRCGVVIDVRCWLAVFRDQSYPRYLD